MKNIYKQINLWSFATAKLQAKRRSLLAIIAIAMITVIGFSFAACDPADILGGKDPNDGKKNEPDVFIVDINNNEDSNWDYMIVGKDGSSILFNVDESGDVPTTMVLMPDKDSDTGFSYFFDENGLPDKMVANGIVFCFDNFNGYQFDFTIIYPNGTVEYVLGIETDVYWDAYNDASGRRSVAQGRFVTKDIKNVFEVIENVVGVGTCIGAAIPPLTAVLAVGCGAFVVDKIADVVIDEVLDGNAADGAGVIKDSVGCVTSVLKGPTGLLSGVHDCGQAVFGAADMIMDEDTGLINTIKDEIDESKARKAEIEKDFSIMTTSLPNGAVGTQYGTYIIVETDSSVSSLSSSVVSGTLPEGLKLDNYSSQSHIGGTPVKAGTFNFTVKVTKTVQKTNWFNKDYMVSATKALSITIAAGPVKPEIIYSSLILNKGTVGTPYVRVLSARGDTPITWSSSIPDVPGDIQGTQGLPPGLQLSEKGAITGTPTTAGRFIFSVTATNASGKDSVSFILDIDPSNSVNGKLTIYNLPGGGNFEVSVFDRGTDISTLAGINTATSVQAVTNAPSGSVFSMLTPSSTGVWTGSGNFPVLLHNRDGSETERANAKYRWASVNFANGTATVNFSSFMAVVSQESSTEANPIPLTPGIWEYGSLSSETRLWYSFNVVSGNTYYLWLDDSDNAGGTLDARIAAFDSNRNLMCVPVDMDSGSFIAGRSGTVKIQVYSSFTGDTGTFAVAYSTSSTRPVYGGGGDNPGGDNPGGDNPGDGTGSETNPIPLTVNVWADGSITSTASDSAVWYSFSVTGGTTYYVWWNGGYSGYGDGTKTLDIYAIAYYSNGTSIFTVTNQGWTSPRSFTASSSGTVKIKVYPYSSGSTGTFAVAYSTTNVRPGSGPSNPVGPTNWTAVSNSTFDTTDISAVAYGNNRWVAGGKYGTMAYSTDNGVTWTAVADSTFESTDEILAIAYGNNKFVAVGEHGAMAYSSDGANWTAVSLTDAFGYLGIYAIAYGNNRFVAGSRSGTASLCKIAYSDDGINWTAAADSTFDEFYAINAIAYGNNRFVAVSSYGTMAYSTDGVNWTAVSNSTFGGPSPFYEICDIAYGSAGNAGNRFVAVGNRGKMAYSTDGVNWTAVSNSTFGTSTINAIAYGNNRFVAMGSNGKMAYSADGASWTTVANSTGLSFEAIAYGNDRFVSVGRYGKMAYCDW